MWRAISSGGLGRHGRTWSATARDPLKSAATSAGRSCSCVEKRPWSPASWIWRQYFSAQTRRLKVHWDEFVGHASPGAGCSTDHRTSSANQPTGRRVESIPRPPRAPYNGWSMNGGRGDYKACRVEAVLRRPRRARSATPPRTGAAPDRCGGPLPAFVRLRVRVPAPARQIEHRRRQDGASADLNQAVTMQNLFAGA